MNKRNYVTLNSRNEWYLKKLRNNALNEMTKANCFNILNEFDIVIPGKYNDITDFYKDDSRDDS